MGGNGEDCEKPSLLRLLAQVDKRIDSSTFAASKNE